MKNIIKNIITIILIVIGIILLDTIQARIFKNSPIISKRESLPDNDSYVDRGMLINTYYCTKEKDIVTISYHYKKSKFTCPIDNEDNLYSYEEENINNIEDIDGITMTIKEGTLTNKSATIIITDTTNNENVYGSYYRIDKYEFDKWNELDIIYEDNYAWISIGYLVDKDNKLEMDINWSNLYGELNKGKYRIVKKVNNKYFSVEFQID